MLLAPDPQFELDVDTRDIDGDLGSEVGDENGGELGVFINGSLRTGVCNGGDMVERGTIDPVCLGDLTASQLFFGVRISKGGGGGGGPQTLLVTGGTLTCGTFLETGTTGGDVGVLSDFAIPIPGIGSTWTAIPDAMDGEEEPPPGVGEQGFCCSARGDCLGPSIAAFLLRRLCILGDLKPSPIACRINC